MSVYDVIHSRDLEGIKKIVNERLCSPIGGISYDMGERQYIQAVMCKDLNSKSMAVMTPSQKIGAAPKSNPLLPQKTIDGGKYWHDPETNGLWAVTGNALRGAKWVGYFQPNNKEEPIMFTEAFGDRHSRKNRKSRKTRKNRK